MKRHSLLHRQLKKVFGSPENAPDELEPLLKKVDQAYRDFDEDRELLERSLEITSNDLRERYSKIKKDNQKLKEIKKELQKSETKFRKIFNESPIGIALINPDGQYIDVNKSMTEITGYSKKEFLNTHILDFTHPDDKHLDKKLTKKVFERQIPYFQIEKRYIHKSGDIRWVKLTATVLWDEDTGDAVFGLGMIEDITDKKRVQQQLIEAKEKAEEMNRLKSSFLANMSHEIRTPLNAILGFASILEEKLDDEEHINLANRIHNGGNRLLSTINSILDLGKIESDNINFDFENIDISHEVNEIVQLLYPLASEKDLYLNVEFDEKPIFAYLDDHYFGQIMNNLISNAIKFTEEGGVDIKVGITSKGDSSDWAYVAVSDTGKGIEESFMPKLFDEFKQESTGIKRSHEGTGLGLTITKKLTEGMSGSIDINSEEGKGSTFTVYFPTVEDLQKSDQSEHKHDEEVLFNSERHSFRTSDIEILAVEDNIDSQLIIENFAKEYSYTDIAQNAENAIAKFTSKHYDVILMDINLGGKNDGFDLLKMIRNGENSENRDTPVVATTAYAMKDDKNKFIEAGFDDYLCKPFNRNELLNKISDILHLNLS